MSVERGEGTPVLSTHPGEKEKETTCHYPPD